MMTTTTTTAKGGSGGHSIDFFHRLTRQKARQSMIIVVGLTGGSILSLASLMIMIDAATLMERGARV